MLRRLGAVQLDTISVLARSHELVAYARLGAVGRAAGSSGPTGVRGARPSSTGPMPPASFRSRTGRPTRSSGGPGWPRGSAGTTWRSRTRAAPRWSARLRAEGPLTANELGGAKKGGPWWDWSETKIAAEWLLDVGDLVCRERRGFQRVYDLAERAIPAELLAHDWTDEECAARLVAAAGRSLGVATVADLAAYHGLPQPLVRRALPTRPWPPVAVEGWQQPRLRRPRRPRRRSARGPDGRSLLLSPFDSLHLVPGAARAAVRPAPPAGGVHAEGEADLRLLRHAGARRAPRSSGWSTRAAAATSSWPSR